MTRNWNINEPIELLVLITSLPLKPHKLRLPDLLIKYLCMYLFQKKKCVNAPNLELRANDTRSIWLDRKERMNKKSWKPTRSQNEINRRLLRLDDPGLIALSLWFRTTIALLSAMEASQNNGESMLKRSVLVSVGMWVVLPEGAHCA